MYDYDAFGNEGSEDSNDTNSFRYSSYYWDKETGTYYLKMRYYNPRTGRFTQEDPACAGLNFYTYCEGNPILFIDPWGLDSYVFYDPNIYGDDTGLDYAEQLQKELEDCYDEPCHLIPITSMDEFIEAWNDEMGKDGGKIDGVVLLFHGSFECIQFSTKTDKYATTTLFMRDISKLDVKTMNTLILLSCNPGEKRGGGSNFATTMTRRMNAKYLIASDGNVFNPIVTESFSIGSDITYILLGTTKNPSGFKVYEKNSKGVVSANEIFGTKFKGIKRLIIGAKIHANN